MHWGQRQTTQWNFKRQNIPKIRNIGENILIKHSNILRTEKTEKKELGLFSESENNPNSFSEIRTQTLLMSRVSRK